ncbi:hypothetical protein JZ751_020083 [Albula glossodonta]|uniref:Uncharacterized protein n=1 Tax=Albula glossodonta TaxID=121402 RepID=A0A8T2NNU8_9TELE|nr:hypothetical protein JZ751_020083 [Albula glossodonta]
MFISPVKKTRSKPLLGGSVGIDQRMSSSCQACSGVQSQCAHSGQNPVGQPEPVPEVQCFPEASSAVHEHIYSRMGLVNSQAPGSGSLPPPAPQNSTVFNCRLTTSTPAMTPQKSSHTVNSGPTQHSLGSGEPPDCNPPPGQEALMPIRLSRALDSLQSLNLSLQNQLDEMQKDMKALQKENQELQQRNRYLLQVVEDKDRELQQIMQKIELDNTCITLDGDNTILERNCQSKQDTSEKEKSRLSLSLPQGEAVDNGLQHMTR